MGDYRTTRGEETPVPANVRRRRRVRWIVGATLGVAVVVAAGFIIPVPRIVQASGYVTTRDYAEVRPSVSGTVVAVLKRSGETVRKDDILVQLDDTEQAPALAEVRSQERKAESELSRRETEIVQQKKALEDQITIARLREQNAKTKLQRTEELHSRGLAAASAVEDFRLQQQVAAAELQSLVGRDLSVFEREVEVLRHEVDSRRESVTRAEAQLRQRQVRAPIAGQVLRYEFVVGELVRPETVLYEIFGGTEQILKLRIDERYATQVAPGQHYRARLTSYGGLQRLWFEEQVEELRNVIQAEGQKTYGTAYCRFDPKGHSVPPGTTAEARIDTGRIPLWVYLFGLY